MANILVLDDEESIRYTFRSFLVEAGHEVRTAGDYGEAFAHISEVDFDLIFSDIILNGRTGLDFLRAVDSHGLSCPVVLITGYPDVETASEAVRLRAFDYIFKPVEQDALLSVTDRALQFKKALDEKERHRTSLDAAFRSVDEIIVTVDRELTIIGMSEAAKGLCGRGGAKIGNALGSLESGCKEKCFAALIETIQTGKPGKLNRLECRREGQPPAIATVATSPLFDARAGFIGAVMVVRPDSRPAHPAEEAVAGSRYHNLIGACRKMQRIYSLLEDLAGVDTTVLITGESGTGKELAAEALHYRGARAHGPLVKINCSVLPESLLESELFGHVKGAFTGALSDRSGRFQMAEGGTIFLDEIGDISPKVQLSLLRILQEKEFERVGNSTPLKADVRIIAATNKNLRERVEARQFREDLLYRLNVVEVPLPPLRDKREDIPLLVDHFLLKFNKKLKKNIEALSRDVEKLFLDYPWPGNVRELEHVLEHACILCRGKVITLDHLPAFLKNALSDEEDASEKKEKLDARLIVQVLETTRGNKSKASRLLGINRKTLYRHLDKI